MIRTALEIRSALQARWFLTYVLVKTLIVIMLMLLSGGPEVSQVDVVYQQF